MKNQIVGTFLLVSLFPLISVALPQSDPAKEAAIKRIFEVTRAEENYMQVVTQFATPLRATLERSLPPGERPRQFVETFFQKLMQQTKSEIFTWMIQFYDKNFSGEEIQELLQFYESPVGKKFIQVTPQLMQDMIAFIQRRGSEIPQEILREMEKDYPELMQRQ